MTNREGDPQEYEINILIGPCTQDEGLALMLEIQEQFGDRLGAIASLSAVADLEGDPND